MSFQIFIDSGGNIPAEKVKEYGINVISFVNIVDGEELVCFSPDYTFEDELKEAKEYYDKMREGASIKTSLVNSEAFMNAFTPVLKAGEDILYVAIASGISGTFQAAMIARTELLEEFPGRKIEIVDAMNASLGQGIHAINASIMRAEGKDFDEIVKSIRDDVLKMNGLFTTGDLKHLAKTGRVKAPAAILGNLLSIKPILRASKEGQIVLFKKIKGRNKAISTLIDILVSNIENPEEQIIGIAQADCYELAVEVAEKIKSCVKVKDIIITCYDYCTGSHVGPDTLAFFFKAKDRELLNSGVYRAATT